MLASALENLLIAIPAFLVVLTLVVFVHEFGHFQVGRWFGVRVRSFSIGWGAPLFQRTDRHGTVWKISRIPIGGFVSWEGDADASSTTSAPLPEDAAALERARRDGLFHAQKPAVRALVALAGPLGNFVFSTVAFAALIMVVGRPLSDGSELPPRVDHMAEHSAAATAGIRVQDLVVAIDGKAVASMAELKAAVAPKANTEITVTVLRDGQRLDVSVTPKATTDIDATGIETKRGLLGVGAIPREGEIKIAHPGPIEAVEFGLEQTWGIIASTGSYLRNVFTGKASAEHLAGPLGIMQVSGDVAKSAAVGATFWDGLGNLCAAMLQLSAYLSVAIGIANLLPIPILDGGQIVLCGIEALRGKPLDQKAQTIGFNAGLAMMACLILLSTWNDLQRLNVLEFLRGILS